MKSAREHSGYSVQPHCVPQQVFGTNHAKRAVTFVSRNAKTSSWTLQDVIRNNTRQTAGQASISLTSRLHALDVVHRRDLRSGHDAIAFSCNRANEFQSGCEHDMSALECCQKAPCWKKLSATQTPQTNSTLPLTPENTETPTARQFRIRQKKTASSRFL